MLHCCLPCNVELLGLLVFSDLNVLALSDSNVAGKPLLPVNRRKANGKATALSRLVSSKCNVLVEAHVNRQTYALASSAFVLPLSVVYKGPAKPTPVCVKGGQSETRSSGTSGGCGSGNGCPCPFPHVTHLRRHLLTARLPCDIQNHPLTDVNVVFNPLCSIRW